jgi:hypothetical protein
MARPDGPAYIIPVTSYVRAVCPACGWRGPAHDADVPLEAALVRRDLHTHNEEHDEWPGP